MAVDAVVIARVAPIFRRALQRAASAMPSPVGSTPHRAPAAGEGIGAAAPGSSGKSASAGRSNSATTNDGPVREHRPVEDSGALSAAEAG